MMKIISGLALLGLLAGCSTVPTDKSEGVQPTRKAPVLAPDGLPEAQFPPKVHRLHVWEVKDTGLPTVGSWRNRGALEDLDDDGDLDIIMPPPRKGYKTGKIFVFLNDGTGYFHELDDPGLAYPHMYGGVAVGDLNQDGLKDIVAVSHSGGMGIFLQEPGVTFHPFKPKILKDIRISSQVVGIQDFNQDGLLDIFLLQDQDWAITPSGKTQQLFLIQEPDGEFSIQLPQCHWGFGNDFAILNLNEDFTPDLWIANHVFNHPDEWLISQGSDWACQEPPGRPINSYIFQVEKGNQGIYLAYQKYFRYRDEKGKIRVFSRAYLSHFKDRNWKPIAYQTGYHRFLGLSAGDLDGNGLDDVVVFQTHTGKPLIFLQEKKGGFVWNPIETITFPKSAIYWSALGDLDQDGFQELLVPVAGEGSQGGIHILKIEPL